MVLPMIIQNDFVGENEIKRERENARRLRRTNWWNSRLSKGVCYYCNSMVGRDQLTMDHLVPLSRGGKSRKGNVVPSCKGCNNKKKYLLPVEWDEYLRSLSEKPI